MIHKCWELNKICSNLNFNYVLLYFEINIAKKWKYRQYPIFSSSVETKPSKPMPKFWKQLNTVFWYFECYCQEPVIEHFGCHLVLIKFCLCSPEAPCWVVLAYLLCFWLVDQKTKKFLSDTLDPVFGFTSLVRFSWSTADIMLREKGVPIHWYIICDHCCHVYLTWCMHDFQLSRMKSKCFCMNSRETLNFLLSSRKQPKSRKNAQFHGVFWIYAQFHGLHRQNLKFSQKFGGLLSLFECDKILSILSKLSSLISHLSSYK